VSTRSKIPKKVERAVLIKSRRRCCLCFWLDGTDENQKGQIAHLDHKRDNNQEDNLCFLCLGHHDDYDSPKSQSKGFKKGEVKHYRDELYKEIEFRFYSIEVERKLRLAKQEIRKSAHVGLTLRAKNKPLRADAKKWFTEATSLVKRFAGEPAKFDFIHCSEGSGEIDLTTTSGIRACLYIHAHHLKELARAMDATDLIEMESEKKE